MVTTVNKTTKQHLECILTNDERLSYSKEMAENVSSRARTEDALQSFSKQKKAEIASYDSKINLIADKINSGKEYRDVECEIIIDFKKKEKRFVRLDTGEVASKYDLTAEDMQQELNI